MSDMLKYLVGGVCATLLIFSMGASSKLSPEVPPPYPVVTLPENPVVAPDPLSPPVVAPVSRPVVSVETPVDHKAGDCANGECAARSGPVRRVAAAPVRLFKSRPLARLFGRKR